MICLLSHKQSYMKKCTKCGKEKKTSEFAQRKSAKSGICSWCKECYAENARKWAREARRRVLEHYGGKHLKCACCGEKNYEFLCLDHVNGGGCKDRKNIGGGVAFYSHIIKNNFPKGFRVMCHNCNASLGYYGYCPHTKR